MIAAADKAQPDPGGAAQIMIAVADKAQRPDLPSRLESRPLGPSRVASTFAALINSCWAQASTCSHPGVAAATNPNLTSYALLLPDCLPVM